MPTPPQGFRVTLPGADDIYDLIPDSAYSPGEQARRRADRARRIEESPTPEIARDVSQILTRIDDVQDAFVTLSLLTRLAVPQVRALAPFAKAIATAADITNLATIMQRLGLVGGSWKGSLFRHLATQPGTYSTRLRRTLRTSRVSPTIGELLQVLQTTDLAFGTGMQLGAVMGIPADLASLAIRGGTLDVPVDSLLALATLAPVFLSASPWLSLAGLAAGFAMSALPGLTGQTISIPVPGILPTVPETAAQFPEPPIGVDTLTALEVADQVLTDTSYLDALGQELTPTEHAILELTRYQALALLAIPAIATPGGLLQPDFHPPVSFPATLPRRPLAWLKEHPSDPHAVGIASLVGQAWDTLALSLEPAEQLETRIWSDHALAVARSVELSTPVPSPGPPPALSPPKRS